MLWIIIISVTAYLFYTKLWKPQKYWHNIGVKQTESWPVLGHMAQVAFQKKSMTEFVLETYNQFPKERFFGINQFSEPTLIVKDLDLIKKITVKDFDHFEDHRPMIPEGADPMLNKILFSLKGMKWRNMRATLSPAFTSSKMRSMFVLMSECATNLTQHYLEKGEAIQELEMRDTFTRFTNDVIASVTFGVKCDSLKERDNIFYTMGVDTTNMSGLRTMIFFAYSICPSILKFFKVQLLPQRIYDFFSRILKETMQEREKKGIIRPDILHLLMEAKKGKLKHDENERDNSNNDGFATVEESTIGKQRGLKDLNDDDLTAQALQFFFGGFDTSALMLCLTAYELALNPNVQKTLQEEIDATFKTKQESLTYEELLNMKYLDMVVSETLRKWPPGFVLDRVCGRPYTISSDSEKGNSLRIEKDTVLWIPVIGFHRDPQYFPNPEEFDPERFSDENKANIVPGSYMPFGVGPRNCIASRFALIEVKTLFVHLLRKFSIEIIGKTQVPLVFDKSKFDMDSANGFWLGLKAR